MTQQEYEQKRAECWEECAAKVAVETTNLLCKSITYTAFDRAYALGKKEKDAEKSEKSKRMCLRDKSKVCNKCHACDIDTDAWHSMYSR